MQTKFRRHQPVRLLQDPDPEYIEYYEEIEEPIKKGMLGRVNILLPNGQYHIEIHNKKGEIIAYAAVSEDDIEPAG